MDAFECDDGIASGLVSALCLVSFFPSAIHAVGNILE